jgi:rhamnosyltransferase
VCLAAFNGVRYIQQQLDSILSQADVQVTVFVSVDRSTDGTEAWFSDLQAREPRVVLLPVGAVFGGAARNFFRLLRDIDFAAFDYVAYADQDDIWLPGKLKRARDVLAQSDAQGYSSDVVAFWDSGKSLYIKKSYPQRRWDYLFESAGPGCTFVFSRLLAVQLQGVARQRAAELVDVGLHDWFTYAYARANGFRWVIDDHASLMYRQHAENQVGVNAGWAAFQWRARQILNGWGLTQARLIAYQVGLQDDAFVRRWSRGGRWQTLVLAFQAAQCRRRPRDRVLFALSCLALTIVGWK